MNALFEEPAIPPRLRRPLAAAWISLALHVAMIALVQVAPPQSASVDAAVIEARLVPAKVAPPPAEPATPAPEKTPQEMPPEAPHEIPLAASPPPADDPPADTPEPIIAQPAAVAPPAEAEPDTAADGPPTAAPPVAATPPAAIATAVDLTYYSARELDTQPRALHDIVPDYPAAADRERLSGKVRLQLRLEADGRISDIEIISSTPPGVFDEATIDAFREARFAPARRGDRPVRAQLLIEVVYDWEGRFRYPDRPASP